MASAVFLNCVFTFIFPVITACDSATCSKVELTKGPPYFVCRFHEFRFQWTRFQWKRRHCMTLSDFYSDWRHRLSSKAALMDGEQNVQVVFHILCHLPFRAKVHSWQSATYKIVLHEARVRGTHTEFSWLNRLFRTCLLCAMTCKRRTSIWVGIGMLSHSKSENIYWLQKIVV